MIAGQNEKKFSKVDASKNLLEIIVINVTLCLVFLEDIIQKFQKIDRKKSNVR